MGRHQLPHRIGGLRRLRASLAGALVLGVGATMTLAAWTDSENATGSFAASVFDTESSANGTTWASNTGSPGATLTFAATAMSPGTSSYAPLDVRTSLISTVGGTVTLNSATPTGALGAVLEYRAIRITTATTCGLAAFSGTPTYIAGGSGPSYIAVNTVPTGGSQVATTLGPAGSATRYCFDVRVQQTAANTYQGTTASVTWLFGAVSTS
jgi:predicted ribosomally synthesized peptide with SipW-like signal peptide